MNDEHTHAQSQLNIEHACIDVYRIDVNNSMNDSPFTVSIYDITLVTKIKTIYKVRVNIPTKTLKSFLSIFVNRK